MHREKVCTAEPDNKCRAFCLTTKLLPHFYFFTIIDMTREITIDDVIEFIIRNCDNIELMDKISKTSFPFTSKYLNRNKEKGSVTITPCPTYPYSGYTLCSDEALSPNKE